MTYEDCSNCQKKFFFRGGGGGILRRIFKEFEILGEKFPTKIMTLNEASQDVKTGKDALMLLIRLHFMFGLSFLTMQSLGVFGRSAGITIQVWKCNWF